MIIPLNVFPVLYLSIDCMTDLAIRSSTSIPLQLLMEIDYLGLGSQIAKDFDTRFSQSLQKVSSGNPTTQNRVNAKP